MAAVYIVYRGDVYNTQISVDTVFILLSHVCRELWPKNGISIMAVLICILLEMLKGARVASSGFLISTLQRYKNCKKTL